VKITLSQRDPNNGPRAAHSPRQLVTRPAKFLLICYYLLRVYFHCAEGFEQIMVPISSAALSTNATLDIDFKILPPNVYVLKQKLCQIQALNM
jgi:hypothetical protein